VTTGTGRVLISYQQLKDEAAPRRLRGKFSTARACQKATCSGPPRTRTTGVHVSLRCRKKNLVSDREINLLPTFTQIHDGSRITADSDSLFPWCQTGPGSQHQVVEFRFVRLPPSDHESQRKLASWASKYGVSHVPELLEQGNGMIWLSTESSCPSGKPFALHQQRS